MTSFQKALTMIGLPADHFTAQATAQGTLIVTHHDHGQVVCHLPDALATPQAMAQSLAYALKHQPA